MAESFNDLIDRKLLLVTGKGGIGKTLVGAALAQKAAAVGKKVCLIESTAHDQIAPLFGRGPIGHKVTLVSDNIWAVNLNATETFKDFIVKYLGLETLFNKVFSHSLVQSLLAMLPALSEITLLGRIYYACELAKDPQFDLVIFDGFSSGHFYNLLTTPEAVMNSGLVGPVITETRRIRDYMGQTENCGVLVVANPEPLIASESVEFVEKLIALNWVSVAALIVNRYQPSEGVSAELEALVAAGNDLSAAAEYCLGQVNSNEDTKKQLDACADKAGIPLLTIFNQGAVVEPLSADFHCQFFGGRDE